MTDCRKRKKRHWYRERQLRTGLTLFAIVLAIALLGPWIAPHDANALVGTPYGLPGSGAWLGFDYLGRDVWSRLLAGGLSIFWMSISAALIALVAGTAIGMIAAYRKGPTDQAVIWSTDVLFAFPDLILVLLIVSMLGRAPWLIVLLVALAFLPGVIRLARGITLGIVEQEYVDSARMLGFSSTHILVREILPNAVTPLLVHLGVMLTWAVSMLSGLSFLGYGVAPPAADWGLMINENRAGLIIQPWAVLGPVAMIALFTLGTNLIAEGIGRINARIEDA
ncbi:MAG TPA: ABC transporter permease [Sphingobium sp.]